jgi:hypothetical protein
VGGRFAVGKRAHCRYATSRPAEAASTVDGISFRGELSRAQQNQLLCEKVMPVQRQLLKAQVSADQRASAAHTVRHCTSSGEGLLHTYQDQLLLQFTDKFGLAQHVSNSLNTKPRSGKYSIS